VHTCTAVHPCGHPDQCPRQACNALNSRADHPAVAAGQKNAPDGLETAAHSAYMYFRAHRQGTVLCVPMHSSPCMAAAGASRPLLLQLHWQGSRGICLLTPSHNLQAL
jgi:hypothetical protein